MEDEMNILVTGGAGYIGSHACIELIQQGYDVIVVDNLSNSKQEVLEAIREITGKQPLFYKIDLKDQVALEQVFKEQRIDAVIHFAGLKAVGESVEKPLLYYEENLNMTFTLCKIMKKYEVKRLIFSSSATVYGKPKEIPIKEESPLCPLNPYGKTKYMIEELLKDLYAADPTWHTIILRYFNPIGAHESGKIGENPIGTPQNLIPYIGKVAVGELEYVHIFGDDYETPDGTGVRDYIHVVDLAKGHLCALERVMQGKGIEVFNLGTGTGYSVYEVIRIYEQVAHRHIHYEVMERRPGDIGTCYASADKAHDLLGWQASYSIEEMCRDSWHFMCEQQKHIEGGA